MQSVTPAIPGVILAGGAGRRIGGAKAHVTLAGRPLWSHVASRIQPQVGTLAVNGSGRFGVLPVVVDMRPGLGPLEGILRAMEWGTEQGATRVLTVAVDTPFLPIDLVERLSQTDGPVSVARTPDGFHGTSAVWDVALAGTLLEALRDGVRKVTQWADSIGITPVDFDDAVPPPFFNINTSEDLAKAEEWMT